MSGLFAGTSLQRPVTCERCEKPIGLCICPRGKDGKIIEPKKQQARVRREKRAGKQVTVIAGLGMREGDLKEFLKPLKSKLGTGGTVTTDSEGQGEIELQGDHAAKLVEYLTSLGYNAKRSGG
jgi:translation initiation factor 1